MGLQRDCCTKTMADCSNDPVAKLAQEATNERNKICGDIPSAQVLSQLAGLGEKEYLDQTVMPLVYIGLERLLHERPPNPVDWMAAFLLKNKALAPYKSL